MTRIAEISHDSGVEDSEETRVRKLAKHMLKSTLFIGTFQEKRFVEPLNSYRDVIKVADDETDFIENLIAVRKRCAKFYSKSVWIGITEPKTIGAPAGYNLWVILNEEVFGSYWYKIKNVEFHGNEVRLKLEIVRPVSREKTPVRNITPKQAFEDISMNDVSQLGTDISIYFKEKIKELFTETLTCSNIKAATIFIFLLISTLLTFLVQVIQYLLDYFLKLLHETSGLVKVCSPIIINFMRLIMNTINGFYTLIAVMWRDRSPPTINQNLYQMLPYDVPNNVRALRYPGYEANSPRNRKFDNSYNSSVRITPLN